MPTMPSNVCKCNKSGGNIELITADEIRNAFLSGRTVIVIDTNAQEYRRVISVQSGNEDDTLFAVNGDQYTPATELPETI